MLIKKHETTTWFFCSPPICFSSATQKRVTPWPSGKHISQFRMQLLEKHLFQGLPCRDQKKSMRNGNYKNLNKCPGSPKWEMMGHDCHNFLDMYGYQYFWCFTQLQFGRFQWLDLQQFKCVVKKKHWVWLLHVKTSFSILFRGWYCWWKTSGTSGYDTYAAAIIFRVLYMPSGCLEFLPSIVLVTTHDVSCLQECLDERVHRLSLNHHGFGASLRSTVDQQWKVKVNEGLLLGLLLKWSKHI